jgi:hypothetical protein
MASSEFKNKTKNAIALKSKSRFSTPSKKVGV